MAVTNSNAKKYLYGSAYVAPILGKNAPGIVPQVYPGSTGSGTSQNVNTSAYGGYTPNPHDAPGYNPATDPTSSAYKPTTIGGGQILGASTSQFQMPSTISSSILGSSSMGSINLPSAPSAATTMSATPGASSFNLASLLTPEMSAYGYSVDPASGMLVLPEMQQEPQKVNKLTDMLTSLKETMPKPPSTLEAYKQLEEQSGIKQKQNTVNALTSQLNAVVAKQQQDLLTTRGTASQEGVTEAVYGGIAAQINREAAIKTLPLAAQLQAAQGDLQSAQQYLSTYADLIINDAKAQYDYQIKLFDSVFNYATKQEQNILEEKAQQKQNEFTIQRDNLAYARDLAGEALANGQSALAGRITSLMQNPTSPTFGDDLASMAGQIVVPQKTTGGTSSGSTGNAVVNDTIQTYADLLAQGKISLSNVPQSVRNAVVAASEGIINKPLSDTAIKEITQTQSAIENLQALRNVVQNNLQFIGPISGLQRLNPWSDARKVQSEVDRVRQIVGKALEGGVLRKEDEEKYKKILATLNDTPETAIYKIDALIGQLDRDISNYKSTQAQTGRYVGPQTTIPSQDDLRAKYQY